MLAWSLAQLREDHRGDMMRRKALDIEYDIVVSTLEPRSQTKLMYASALNYTMLMQYLGRLNSLGYIVYDSDSKVYSATVKGREFIKSYEQYQKAQQELRKAYSVLQGRQELPSLSTEGVLWDKGQVARI